MKIVRNIEEDGNINTELHSFLTQIKDKPILYYNDEHQMRHPLSIYNLGQSRFYSAYLDLLNYINPQTDISRLTGDLQMFTKTNELIESLICFIDDIYSILKCFYPADATTKKYRFCDLWLESIDEALIKEFKKNIEFTFAFRTINNEIKHNHGRLYKISLNAGINGNAFGFFIVKYDDGSLNAFEIVHKRYRGMQTAFSYNWFLLEILAQFYFISKYATGTLRKVIMNQHNLDIKPERVIISDDNIKDVVKKLDNALSNVLFEDEYEKPISQIDFTGKELIIKKPADRAFLKRFKMPHTLKYEVYHSGDGIMPSFGCPYLE
ncbi:hypothetical protein [Aminipila sp.]|uniref:hypothetical protein n=1 Tax=Aminipila sp. TaxID=2060095 RepID=UPI00289A1F13|nr:hypothetical protein [Aminipila sp.]